MKTEFKFGDICLAKCTAPARYFGHGKCLYISCSDNDLGIDDAESLYKNEHNFPLPTDELLSAANVGFYSGLFEGKKN